jgi:hypothetical protein
MPLSVCNLASSFNWKLTQPVSGMEPRTHKDSAFFTLVPDLDDYDNIYAAEVELDENEEYTIDLYDFTNPNAEEVSFQRVIAIMVSLTGGDGLVFLEPGDTNPLDWFIGAGGSIPIHSGGGFTWVGSTPEPVDATHRALKLVNPVSTGGTEPITAKVVVLGSTTP